MRLGTNLIEAGLNGGPLFWYDWLVKGALTVFTLSAGFQGGEVTPLFSIGAALGALLGPCLGLPAAAAAALGLCFGIWRGEQHAARTHPDRRGAVRP